MDFTEYGRKNIDTIKESAMAFVKRCDQCWDKYDFLRDKKASAFDGDDWENLVELIEERFDDVKAIKKSFKNGYKAVLIISGDISKTYLQYTDAGVTLDEALDYVVKYGLDKKYPYHSGLFLASMPEMLEVM